MSTTPNDPISSQTDPRRWVLRQEIATFLRRRRIEAATAASIIALSSYSQAFALSLSDVQVQSALGQPLRAAVTIGVAPGEIINTRCLTVRPASDNGMPGVGPVSLSLASGVNAMTLNIRGSSPMREPMSEMVLSVNCAGTPVITRSFLVMLDPPGAVPAAASATAGPATTAPAVATRQRAARSAAEPARRAARSRPLIEPGSRYTVQPGDILSVIASRVANRPDYTVWPIAQRIYDTNPEAFDSQAPDSLRVGATIDIPRLVGTLAVAGSPQQVRAVRRRTGAAPAAPQPDAERSLRLAQASGTAPSPLPRAVSTFEMTGTMAALVDDRRRPGEPQPLASAGGDAVERPTDAITRRRADVATAPVAAPSQPDPVPLDKSGADAPAANSADIGSATVPPAVSAPAEAPQPGPTAAPQPTVVAAAPPPAYVPPPIRTGMSPWVVGIATLLGAGLGALATLISLRRWLAGQRAEQEEALARAKRHEQRLAESRRQRPSDEAPSIVVQEQSADGEAPRAAAPRKEARRVELPRADAIGGNAPETIGSVEEVLASAAAVASSTRMADAATVEKAASEAGAEDLSLTVDAIEPADELDFNVFEAPDESALALLEKDYAQTQASELAPDPDATAMLTPEQLGMTDSDATQMVRGKLDLELPQADPEDTVMAVAGIDDVVDSTADDPTEMARQLERELAALTDDSPTSQSPLLGSEAGDIDNDPTTSLEAHDASDYYHLEASSIRKVDALAFERDDDDDDTRMVSTYGK